MVAEVAAVGADPFVVLLDQDVPGQAEQRRGFGERADHVDAAFDLLVDAQQRVRGPDLPPVLRREAAEREGTSPLQEPVHTSQ